MVFQTEPNVQRARAHIESGDRERLSYACLELRFALEKIVYQKLQLRMDKIAIEEIGAWQPRRAMERLMELVDEHLGKDSLLRMAPESEYGKGATEGFVTVGQNKGISPREIGSHWQKLGSFLHARMPKKKGEQIVQVDEVALSAYLKEVIAYIEDLTSTHFDSHFSMTVTFRCGQCGQGIVRNSDLLKEEDIVQCQNPNCDASYIAHIKGDEFSIEPYLILLSCKKCDEVAQIGANTFARMKTNEAKTFVCDRCGERHTVRWLLQYALEEDTKISD